MHDALRVRRGEAVRDLNREIDGLAHRKRTSRQKLLERHALEQVRYDVRNGSFCAGRLEGILPDVVDRQNVWMSDRGGRPRLVLEAPQSVGILGEGCRQDLDRNVSIQPRIPGAIDLAHPPCAERRKNLIGSELRSVP